MPTHSANELLQHLSPPFLVTDDAARYAVAQIDTRKGRAQGGYILSDPDGHCRATRPVEGALDDFLFDDALSMESIQHRLLPEGYHYRAYYFCDIDRQAEIKQARPSWSAQRITLTQSTPSSTAVAACFGVVTAFYTLGPEGSLVRFLARAPQAPRWPALPPEQAPVEDYIHQLVSHGTLSVVIGSPVWAGWRGDIPLNWKAFEAATQAGDTDPFISQVYTDVPSAMAFVRQRLLLEPRAWQLGFLLKHSSLERFAVTEPVKVDEPVFNPHRVFRSDNEGGFFLPQAYRIVGMYWLAVDAPAPPAVKEPWLYERFILPKVLAPGINLHRVLREPGMALYVCTVDGAVLRYAFSDSAAESRFYNPPQAAKQGMDNGQQAALDEGRLAVRTYIQQLAGAGELSVVHTSPLWDVAGRVTAQWQPYATYPQAALSPAFVLADDAARYAHGRIGGRREREYIGLILESSTQRFVATEPQENHGARFDWRQVGPVDRDGVPLLIPPGFSLRGIYSSRAATVLAAPDDEAQIAAQMFMDTDIHRVLTLAPRVPLVYLSGAADSLIAFEPYAPELSRELRESSAPARGGSQLHRLVADHSWVPSDVVRAMALAGTLRVVVGNRLWGRPARIDSDWSAPYDVDPHDVPAQPQLGAICATPREAVEQACDARRRAYAAPPGGLGFVLKSKAGDGFVATQTVAAAALDRLLFASEFGAPALIEGFNVHAVYYSATGLATGLRGQAAWVGRHFIGAEDLYAALYNGQGGRRARFGRELGVYLSVLDGALLALNPGADPFALFLDASGTLDPQALPARLGQTLTAQGYVREVAQAGELTVLAASACWDVPGRVNQDWLAYSQVERHALGPCFISADDAARHAQIRLGNRRDRVYGGLILRRTDGLYTATEPVPVYVENFAPGWIRHDELVVQSKFLGGSTAVARYHTRLAGELPFALSEGERAVYQNMFATDFLGAMLDGAPFSTGLEYLFCEDGALLSVASEGGALAHSLALKLKVRGATHPKQNALEQSLRDATLTPSE